MRAELSSLLFVSLLMGRRGYLPRFFVPIDGAVGLSSLLFASLLMGEMILHKEKTAEAVFPVVSDSQ